MKSYYGLIFLMNLLMKILNPLLTSGIEQGEWKLNYNWLYFEECCKLISEIAFSLGK